MRRTIQTLLAATATLALGASAAHAVPVLDPDNGHYYQYVDELVTWDAAFAAAQASTYQGRVGYLATITTESENNFLDSLSTHGWLGGNDAAVTDEWRWVDGPEAGQLFYQANTATSFGFTNWYPGNPSGGEHYLEMLPGKLWNDAPHSLTRDYFIEYSGPAIASGAPEPAAWALMIGGFGLAGAALRRRRALSAA